MEQIGAALKDLTVTQNVTSHVTNHALNENKANHVNMICTTYDTIPKKDYGLLLRKMESWGIVAPKAIVKKYGVFIVKRAVEYTEATPHVRNKAGYMTYMCGQFKKEAAPAVTEQSSSTVSKMEIVEKQNPPVQSPLRAVKSKKGIFIPPNIISWKDAREFLCKLTDDDLLDEDVLVFANKLKRQYNFA